ncbi:MAG: GNAT family N-acetyltransferase [Candidatus Cybelea sp.]
MLVEVRKAHDRSDFQKLHDLFVEYEADLSEELRHGVVPDIAALDETYDRRNAAFLATCEGDEIGCVAVKEFDAETALMLHLFVQPRRRGLGAARLLVTAAIEFARAQRFGRMVLDTNKEQLVPAYLLYRSLGFEECEPFTTVTYEFPTFMQLPLG